MIVRYLFSLLFWFTSCLVLHGVQDFEKKNRVLLDTIEAVAVTADGPSVITHFETERLGLTGERRSLDDQLFERLVYGDAQKFKMVPSNEMVERFLARIAKEQNLTAAQLDQIIANAGFSKEEAMDYFRLVQAVNQMFDFRIRSNLIVPRRMIQEYYDQNPEYLEAEYTMSRAVVPITPKESKAALRKRILQAIKGRKGLSFEWGPEFVLRESEIAPEKIFLTKIKEGHVSRPIEIPEGFELYRMKKITPKRLRPLEERYRDIADMLRGPKFQQLLEDYRKSLFEQSTIIYPAGEPQQVRTTISGS